MEGKLLNYEAPCVEVLEVEVEQGFATSTGAQTGDWIEGEWGDVTFE